MRLLPHGSYFVTTETIEVKRGELVAWKGHWALYDRKPDGIVNPVAQGDTDTFESESEADAWAIDLGHQAANHTFGGRGVGRPDLE